LRATVLNFGALRNGFWDVIGFMLHRKWTGSSVHIALDNHSEG